ncbi:hypothetical protein [Aestuariivivens sediminicola]|nr:hypothetical protein [Aestuariivivens sediminicola]
MQNRLNVNNIDEMKLKRYHFLIAIVSFHRIKAPKGRQQGTER